MKPGGPGRRGGRGSRGGRGGRKGPAREHRGGAPQDDEQAFRDLERFLALVLEADALEPFGVDPEEAADLLFDAPAGTDPIDALAPRVASGGRAERSAELLEGLARDPRAAGIDPRDQRALSAAARLARDAADDGGLPDHPFWEVLLAASLQRAIATGTLFGRFVLPALDLDWAAAAIARALADPGVVRRLTAAGLRPPADAAGAVEGLGELAADEEEALPALGTDAVLHLLRERHRMLSKDAERVHAEGLGADLRRDLEARADAACRADLTPELAAAAQEDALKLALATGGDGALAAFLALAAPGPPHENQLLRGLAARALRDPLLPEAEEELAVAVWADPEDQAALAAYEQHLRPRSCVRAERVKRYAAAL